MLNEIKKVFFENGNLKMEIPYVDGRKTGRAKYYYENGKVKTETDYCDNVIDGYVRTYFEDGGLESVETYSHGKRNNDLVLYNRDGKKVYSHNNEDYYYSCDESDHHFSRHL